MAGAEALEALVPADRARARANAVTASERDAPLSAVLMHTGHTGRYARALALGEGWLIPTATALDADPASPVWAEGWIGLASTYMGLGRLAEARDAVDRACAGYERAGLHVAATVAYFIMLRWLTMPYSADDIRERERVLASALAAGERGRGAWDDFGFVGALDWLGIALRLVEGRWDDPGFAQTEALIRREACEYSIAQSADMPRVAASGARRTTGSMGTDRCHCPRGVATEPGVMQAMPASETRCVAVSLALDEGDLPLARAWLEAHDRWLDWSGAVLGRSAGQALWARYHQQIGDSTQAYACAQSALDHATSPRQPLALLAAHRLLGELDTNRVATRTPGST